METFGLCYVIFDNCPNEAAKRKEQNNSNMVKQFSHFAQVSCLLL